ncbi:MAG TPA: OsmC family peroxiredoxin, partial [Candidatus Berkiella sp.]|nr:OsmC family peroxiredoxin [Candidatus Berkiella sp.]
SSVLNNTPYSFTTRFADEKGTNPEELIAAAHAGCFTMALSAILSQAGFVAESLQTQAVVALDQVEGNWTVTAIDLSLTGKIPGIDNTKFQELATQAKQNCPISRLLNTKINLKAELQ